MGIFSRGYRLAEGNSRTFPYFEVLHLPKAISLFEKDKSEFGNRGIEPGRAG
jgi:hypothetical protein